MNPSDVITNTSDDYSGSPPVGCEAFLFRGEGGYREGGGSAHRVFSKRFSNPSGVLLSMDPVS